MASLHIRIPDEMESDIQRLTSKLGYETVSLFVRSCLRQEIERHKLAELVKHMEETNYTLNGRVRKEVTAIPPSLPTLYQTPDGSFDLTRSTIEEESKSVNPPNFKKWEDL